MKANVKNTESAKVNTNVNAETLIIAVLVASVAILVCYFVYVAIVNFNLDLFIKSLI